MSNDQNDLKNLYKYDLQNDILYLSKQLIPVEFVKEEYLNTADFNSLQHYPEYYLKSHETEQSRTYSQILFNTLTQTRYKHREILSFNKKHEHYKQLSKEIDFPCLYYIRSLKYDIQHNKWLILDKIGLACIFSTNPEYRAYTRYRDNCNDLSEACYILYLTTQPIQQEILTQEEERVKAYIKKEEYQNFTILKSNKIWGTEEVFQIPTQEVFEDIFYETVGRISYRSYDQEAFSNKIQEQLQYIIKKIEKS